MKKRYINVLAGCFLALGGLQAQTFTERNGSLNIEAEDLNLNSSWKKQTSLNGYKGSGYINWTGDDQFRSPGSGIISASIKINTPGKYKFQWISKVGIGDNPTEHNDSWLKFPNASAFYAEDGGDKIYPKGSGKTPNPEGAGGQGYFKVYINSTTNWTDRSWTSDNDPHAIFVEFNTAGTYTMQIGARSNGHLIDQIRLRREGGSGNTLKEGRVAVVADGNYRDSDDIAGTPVSLAILRAFGKHGKLVHYSHSCDLKPGANDPGGKFREVQMQESCDGTASRWGGFDGLKFYNCQTEQTATINDLRDKINASTENSPLWIIEAGEPDIMWEAVNKSQQAKRKYVYIVTHHPANDRGDFHDLSDVMALGIPNANLKRIPDQNVLLKKPLNTWHWARDHQDSRVRWLWARGFRAQEDDQNYRGIRGDMDPSDAGMIYYWCTLASGGDENCDVPKLRELFNGYVNSTPSADYTPPAGYTVSVDEKETVTVNGRLDIAYGVNGKFEYLLNQTSNVTCNTVTFGKDPEPGVVKKCYVRETILREPYNSSPIMIPGTLQAEEYDKGRQGDSYNDTDAENKGADVANFRTDYGVDIGEGNGGKVVGWTANGEWIEYTVDVATAGDYNVVFTVASKNGGGKLKFSIDGNDVKTMNVPKTDDWAVYTTMSEKMTLSSGQQIIRLSIENDGFNIDKIEFSEANVTGVENLFDTNALTVYPNPSNGGLFHLSETKDWKVYTTQGLLISEGTSKDINLPDQASGTYLLEVGSSRTLISVQ